MVVIGVLPCLVARVDSQATAARLLCLARALAEAEPNPVDLHGRKRQKLAKASLPLLELLGCAAPPLSESLGRVDDQLLAACDRAMSPLVALNQWPQQEVEKLACALVNADKKLAEHAAAIAVPRCTCPHCQQCTERRAKYTDDTRNKIVSAAQSRRAAIVDYGEALYGIGCYGGTTPVKEAASATAQQ